MLSYWKRWAPRATARVDATNEHIYRSAPWPERLTTVPVATYLAGRDDRYRLLTFDLDAGRYGPEAVLADTRILVTTLNDLNVAHLVVASGPSGGHHVWIRIDTEGIAADTVANLAKSMRAHLPTLDIAPLTNPKTGAVRIPGSPHRHGGASTPILTGHDLAATLTDIDTRPTPPEVADWLIARFPTIDTPSNPHQIQPTGVPLTGQGAGARLNRARTELSAATNAVLTAAPPPNADRSAIAWSVLLGMAASGWCWTDVVAHINEPGLTRLADDYRQREAHALSQWQKALTIAAETAWPRAALDHTAGDGVSTLIYSVLQAVADDPQRWARKGWASAERVLYALLQTCTDAHSTTIDIDVRRLAEAANVHAATACRALHRLQSEGWITRTAESEGTAAATWRIEEPHANTAATQVESRPQLILPRLHHAQHDVWVWRDGLGGVAERIHLAWQQDRREESIAKLTGYCFRTVHRWIETLGRLRLLRARPQWTPAARLLRVDNVMVGRAQRHLMERLIRDWWNDELAWRKQPGKRRRRHGSGRRRTDRNNLTLPIAVAPRARYGKFPTNDQGRIDYRAAWDRMSVEYRRDTA